jgi:hypothetical protein
MLLVTTLIKLFGPCTLWTKRANHAGNIFAREELKFAGIGWWRG